MSTPAPVVVSNKVLRVPAGSKNATVNKIAKALAKTGPVNIVHVKPPRRAPRKK